MDKLAYWSAKKTCSRDAIFKNQREEIKNFNHVDQIWEYLKYKCGMGTCGTCTSLIISGKKNLPEPTWKEVKVLKEKLDLGYRLACQFRISHDIEIRQDWLFYLIENCMHENFYFF